MMKPITKPRSKRGVLIEQWQQSVERLISQIAEWVANESEWNIEAQNITIEDAAFGNYDIKSAIIDTPLGRVHLEPAASNVLSGRSAVECSVWPSLLRVRLLPDEDSNQWRVLTDSGIVLRQQWNRDNFLILVRDLIEAQ